MSKFVEECIVERIERFRMKDPVEKGFQMMGKDLAREKEAQEWAEAVIHE